MSRLVQHGPTVCGCVVAHQSHDHHCQGTSCHGDLQVTLATVELRSDGWVCDNSDGRLTPPYGRGRHPQIIT